MNDLLYGKLLNQIRDIEIVDTHEHIRSPEEVNQESLHVFRVFENSYARLDFNSAGMPPEVWQYDDSERLWNVWKTFQNVAGLTCYSRNIFRALQDLYGLKGTCITEDNWRDLSGKVTRAYQRDDWYDHVLKKRANITISLLDKYWDVEKIRFDGKYFIPVLRSNCMILGRDYVSPYTAGKVPHSKVESLAQEWGFKLDSFESYLALIDSAITRYKQKGAPTVKISTAYERSLFFDEVPHDEAARLYAKKTSELTAEERTKIQDFMAHYVIRKSTEENLPVQIHTGLLARNANVLGNSNPELVNNLFLKYPDTTFILLHFSAPYIRQALSLVKMFPRVFIDICWVPIISLRIAEQALDECLDMVPYNKVMWGADAFRVEEAYGAACSIREILASVLAGRIQRDELDIEAAMAVSRAILHDNARAIFKVHTQCSCG